MRAKAQIYIGGQLIHTVIGCMNESTKDLRRRVLDNIQTVVYEVKDDAVKYGAYEELQKEVEYCSSCGADTSNPCGCVDETV